MKTKIFTIIFFLIPFISFSQSNSTFDFIFGIERSYRSLSTDDPIGESIIETRDNNELAKMNWRIGFNYNRKLSNKFFIKTGIRLASVGHKNQKIDELRWPSEIGPWGYVNDPSLPDEMQVFTDYRFIEIPIALRYEFSNQTFSPFVEMGISPSYYLTTRTTTKTDIDSKVTSNRGFNSSDFSNIHMVGLASVGTNYNLNSKFQLFGQFAYRYHFTELVDAPIAENLYNYGFEFGLRIGI